MQMNKYYEGWLFLLLIALISAQCNSSAAEFTVQSINEPHYGLLYYSAKDTERGIVGVEFGGLYLFDLTTRKEEFLTQGNTISQSDNFSWSPISRKLIYTVRGDDVFNTEQRELYLLDLTGNKRQLTNNEVSDSDGRWAPNGQTIAFWSNRPDNKWLYLMEPDGSNVRPLFENNSEIEFSFLPFVWSPDSQKLAISTVQSYATPIDLNNLPYGVQIAEAETGKIPTYIPDDHIRVDPGWSSDSNKIVYISGPVKINSFQTVYTTMHILDIQTQKSMLIAEFAAIGPPHWSPIEDVIAFSASTEEELKINGQFNIYLISSDGTGLRRLTDDGFFNVASWSSDGSKLALEYFGEQLTEDEIYVLDLNTNELEQITNNNVLDAFPIWVELD